MGFVKDLIFTPNQRLLHWESDQIIPPDALGKLVRIMKAGNYMIIHPNSWTRTKVLH